MRSVDVSGDTIRVRIPPRYTSATGAAVNKQNSTETNTSITLIQRNIGLGFTSKDRTLSIDLFSKRFIVPAMAQLANDIDADGFAAMLGATNIATPGAITAGVPAAWTGTDVSTLRPFLDAGARLDDNSFPRDDQRYIALTPSANAAVVDGLKGLFQSSTEIADQYKRGLMGMGAGFEWTIAQAIAGFTAGTRVATSSVTVTGAQTGASLLIGGGASKTYVAGDQFVIAGTYAINPLTRTASNKLQVFTLTATTTADGSGVATLAVSPTISVTAPNQTVSAGAGAGAAVTFLGAAGAATDVNYVWHRDAVMCAFCPLTTDISGADASMATDPTSGISVRMVKQYQVDTDEQVTRLDVMYGWKLVRPSGVVRVQA